MKKLDKNKKIAVFLIAAAGLYAVSGYLSNQIWLNFLTKGAYLKSQSPEIYVKAESIKLDKEPDLPLEEIKADAVELSAPWGKAKDIKTKEGMAMIQFENGVNMITVKGTQGFAAASDIIQEYDKEGQTEKLFGSKYKDSEYEFTKDILLSLPGKVKLFTLGEELNKNKVLTMFKKAIVPSKTIRISLYEINKTNAIVYWGNYFEGSMGIFVVAYDEKGEASTYIIKADKITEDYLQAFVFGIGSKK